MKSLSYISHGEWRFVSLCSIILIVITLIPVLVGYLRQDENFRFVGFVNPGDDTNTYLSWMKQARDGNFFFEEKFTTEPHPRNIFLLYFLIVGMLSRYLHLPLVVLHQIMRVVCGMALLFMCYIFLSYFIKEVIKRKVAFLLICVSSGFGVFFAVMYHFFGYAPPYGCSPCDLNHYQSTTFWGIDTCSHAELSIAMMLLIFLLMLESYHAKRPMLVIYASALTIALGFFHPYRIPVIPFVLGMYTMYLMWRKREMRKVVAVNYSVLALAAVFGMSFGIIQVFQNPVLQGWYPSQPVHDESMSYFLGMGLLAIMGIFAMYEIVRARREEHYFLVLWALGLFIIIRSPLLIRMRMVEGIQIALSILTCLGIFWLLEKWGWFKDGALKKSGRVFIALFLIATVPTNLMHFIVDMRSALQRTYPYFLSRDLDAMLNWMDVNLRKDEIVLASKKVGNYIPARTGMRTYIGHGAETLNRHRKLREVEQFMSSETEDGFRAELLKRNNIAYFLLSEFERELGDFNPDTAKFLMVRHRIGSVVLYRVNAAPGVSVSGDAHMRHPQLRR